jgi:hypothetical protein
MDVDHDEEAAGRDQLDLMRGPPQPTPCSACRGTGDETSDGQGACGACGGSGRKPAALCQQITLVMDDGRRCVFAGRPQIDPERPGRVVEVVASPPRPLPAGCRWEDAPC